MKSFFSASPSTHPPMNKVSWVLMLRHAAALFVLLLVVVAAARGQRTRPKKTIEAAPQPLSPYILYGPHGYQTFPHSRCQEVSQWLVISV